MKRRLLDSRDRTPQSQQIILEPAGHIMAHRSDWVSSWLDLGNIVTAPVGRFTATRAITAQGRLIWLVRRPDYARAYHARSADPFDAMLEAETAWRRREAVRGRKEAVERIVRELRFLRVRHDVTVDDAYASPLCEEGVEGFLRTLGLIRFRRFPGWLIAWLYAFDRQVGFVLYEARQRSEREQGLVGAGGPSTDPAGQPFGWTRGPLAGSGTSAEPN